MRSLVFRTWMTICACAGAGLGFGLAFYLIEQYDLEPGKLTGTFAMALATFAGTVLFIVLGGSFYSTVQNLIVGRPRKDEGYGEDVHNS